MKDISEIKFDRVDVEGVGEPIKRLDCSRFLPADQGNYFVNRIFIDHALRSPYQQM